MADGDDARGPSDPDSMDVYFAPKEFRYTTATRDVTEGNDIMCVLSAGTNFLYVLSGFDVLAIELRHLKVKGFPKDNTENVYNVFIITDTSLCRSYPTGMIIKDLNIIKVQKSNCSIISPLPPNRRGSMVAFMQVLEL